MSRSAEFTEIIGQPRCGKTTFLLNTINDLVKNGDRALIIDPDGAEPAWFKFPIIEKSSFDPEFKGIKVMQYEDDETFDFLLDQMQTGKLKNLNLVLDDANVYAESHIEQPLKTILRRKRQYMVDIWATAHGYTDVPPKFFTFITQYVLFETSDEIDRRKKEIPSFEKHLEIKRRVDLTNKKTPYYKEFFNKYGEPLF